MRITCEVRDTADVLVSRPVIDVTMSDPPAASTRDQVEALILRGLASSHALNDVRVRVAGGTLEIAAPHATVTVSLRSGAFDANTVRAAIEALGLQAA
jgi:hypothetical protein